jgi:hypothetical protein
MGWKDEAKQRHSDASSGGKYELVRGENTFRLLPNKKGPNVKPYAEYRTHYKVGPRQAIQQCGKDVDGVGSCWLCDKMLPELLRSNSDAKQAQAQAMASKARLCVVVSPINRDTNTFGAPKPLFMDITGARGLSTIIYSLLKETRRSYEDPKRGYNITIGRTGERLKTVWGIPTPDESPSLVPANIMLALQPLESYLFPYSAKAQQDAYYGRESTDTVDDVDNTPTEPDPELSDGSDTGEYTDDDGGEYTDEGSDGEVVDEYVPEEGEGEYAEGGEEPSLEEYEDGEVYQEPEPEPPPPPRRSPVKQASRPAPPPRRSPVKQAAAPVKQASRPAPAPVKQDSRSAPPAKRPAGKR